MDKTYLRPEDLQAIDNTLYEPKSEELTARQVFDLKTDIPAGAEFYAYNVMTRSGAAKIIGNQSDDLPLVDADMKREKQEIYTVAAGFKYSVQELRAAQMTGTPVDSMKAAIARRAIAEKENKVVWIGDADYNIQGVANAVGIQTEAVAAGTSTDTEWASKTSEEIIEDVRKGRAKLTVLPGHNDANLFLLVPPEQYEELNRRYSDYDARTIMNVIEGYNWFAGIIRVPDLRTVGTGGTDSFLIVDASPEVVQVLLPMDITRLEEEWKYPNWKIPVEERTGGAVIRYPMRIFRGDGI